MKNSIQINTKENVQQSKKENATMNNVKTLERKLGTAYQQNLIEMFGYIYFNPRKHTKESLAYEFMKNGKTNERKILRMVNDINNFCPFIQKSLNNIDGRTHYSITGSISEANLDNLYKKLNGSELLYIFLKSLLVKPMSTEEIMENVNVKRKKANEIIEKILDASKYIDDIETEKGHVIGYHLYQ